MDYKYRILEDGNGMFLIQRKNFFIWKYLQQICNDWDFFLRFAHRFDSRKTALDWLNLYNKRQQESEKFKLNSKTIVKCITLSFDDEE